MFICLIQLTISDKDRTKRIEFERPLKRFKRNDLRVYKPVTQTEGRFSAFSHKHRKAFIGFFMSIHLSVCLSAMFWRGSHWTIFREIRY
jgi:hypothetical protein